MLTGLQARVSFVLVVIHASFLLIGCCYCRPKVRFGLHVAACKSRFASSFANSPKLGRVWFLNRNRSYLANKKQLRLCGDHKFLFGALQLKHFAALDLADSKADCLGICFFETGFFTGFASRRSSVLGAIPVSFSTDHSSFRQNPIGSRTAFTSDVITQ